MKPEECDGCGADNVSLKFVKGGTRAIPNKYWCKYCLVLLHIHDASSRNIASVAHVLEQSLQDFISKKFDELKNK